MDLIIRKAPQLRAVGVYKLAIDDVEIEMIPATPGVEDVAVLEDVEPGPVNALDDPMTYLRQDGSIPGMDQALIDKYGDAPE